MLWLFRVVYLLILHHCANGLDFVLDIPSEIEHNTRHEVILSTVHGSVGERLSVAIRAEVRSNGAVVYPYSNQTLLISQHSTETHSLPFMLNPPPTSCNSAVPGSTLCACEISVSITTSTGQNWSKSQGVKIIKTKGHIFIQTERPVYLPGEKVNVRFVPVDDQLRPLHATMKMTIEAPNPLVGGSPLTSWSKTKAASRGIFSRSFFLPETPPLGKWKVSASFHSDQVTDTVFRSSFYVQEFTLPTFEVEITPRKEHFILPDDTDFSFSISARHIHGEKVDGSVYIRYGLVFDDGPDVSTLHRPYESLTSGRLEITQPLSSLVGIFAWFLRFNQTNPPPYNTGVRPVSLVVKCEPFQAKGCKFKTGR